jgi:hypothetical protein
MNLVEIGQDGVLGIIVGPKRDEVKGGWRKLHNKELHDLYSSPNIIRMIKSQKMGEGCSTNCKEEYMYVIGGKARGKEKNM